MFTSEELKNVLHPIFMDLLGATKSSSKASTLLWNSKFAFVCVKSGYVERSGFM